jgi:hypothetical protein
MGSTTPGPGGNDVVGEDFRLNTWDFVSDPACPDAYPAIVAEDVETKLTEDYLRARHPQIVRAIEERAYATAQEVCEEIKGEELRTDIEQQTEVALRLAKDAIREEIKVEVYDEVRQSMSEDFAVKLVRALAEMREAITEEVKSDMASDPELAGAKVALKKIAEMVSPFKPTADVQRLLSEKDGSAAALKQQSVKLENDLGTAQQRVLSLEQKGRQLAFALYVEQRISGRADAENIRKLIGDVTTASTVNDLQGRVDAAIAEADALVTNSRAATDAAVAETTAAAEQRIGAAQRELHAGASRERKLREAVELRIAQIETQLQTVVAAKDGEIARVRAQLAEQEDQLLETAKAGERAALIAYALDRTQGHRHAATIVEDVKRDRLRTKRDIDKAARGLEEAAHEPGGVRERVRRAMSQGRDTMTEDEVRRESAHDADDAATSEAARDLHVIGMSLTEQTNLAGKTRPQTRR